MKKFFELYLGNWALYNTNSTILLVVRLVAGLGMLLHGLPKAENPTGWAGDGFPAVVQFLVVFFEVVTPVAWFIGALTPVFSTGLGVVMVGAILVHVQKGDGFTTRPGYELAVMYLLLSLVLLFLGPGKWSVDYWWLKRRGQFSCMSCAD